MLCIRHCLLQLFNEQAERLLNISVSIPSAKLDVRLANAEFDLQQPCRATWSADKAQPKKRYRKIGKKFMKSLNATAFNDKAMKRQRLEKVDESVDRCNLKCALARVKAKLRHGSDKVTVLASRATINALQNVRAKFKLTEVADFDADNTEAI